MKSSFILTRKEEKRDQGAKKEGHLPLLIITRGHTRRENTRDPSQGRGDQETVVMVTLFTSITNTNINQSTSEMKK